VFFNYIFFFISLLMFPLLGHRFVLKDYPQGERAITHHAGPVRIDEC
jgi:hypothetical protein